MLSTNFIFTKGGLIVMEMISKLRRKADLGFIKAKGFMTDVVKESTPKENTSKCAKVFYAVEGALLSILSVVAGINVAYASQNSGSGNGSGTGTGTGTATGTGAISDLKTAVTGLFETVYGAVAGVMTIACVTIVVICLLIRMLSKNPKSAESATEWMKRALIAFFVFLILSVIIGVIQDLGKSAGGDTAAPWN